MTISKTYINNIGGGCLSSYGTYNFGATLPGVNSLSPSISLSIDISMLALNDVSLSNILNVSKNSTKNSQYLASPYVVPTSLEAAKVDIVKSNIGDGPLSDSITEVIVSSGINIDQTINMVDNKYNLSDRTYGLLNDKRPSTCQIGYNSGDQNG